MLIDLLIEGKEALVIGGGSVGERKALQLLDAGADVTVVSQSFTERLMSLGREGKVKLKRFNVKDVSPIVELGLKPRVVIVSLNDASLNRAIAKQARSTGALVTVVDDPSISDFAMPAVAKVGDVRIGVSTRGRSPAMAAVIRRRVEGMITECDLLHIDLQSYARGVAKRHISSHDDRRRALNMIIEDSAVNRLLNKGRIDDAKVLAEQIIMKVAGEGGGEAERRASPK